ncbi:MAG TPA: hypothetical protein VMR52_08810 [Dehalococcoidia bacterium]|nr:hypothetical protein [Dehalococcoidia bacterium]
MINVTAEAKGVLATTLEASDALEGQALRLALSPEGRYGLTIDGEREGDQTVEHEDRAVLLLDQQVATSLDGATLEAIESPDGARLSLRGEEGQ